MRNLYVPIIRLSLLLLAVFLFSCKGDDIGSTNRIAIRGVVFNDAGQAVAGAAVQAHGKSDVTDENGLFSIENVDVPADRGVVSVSASGYFAGVRGFIAGKNDQSITVVLAEKTTVADFPSSTGGKATVPGGASVDIPANGIETASGTPYSGQVEVAVVHLDPTSDDFSEMVAGNDLVAERTNGEEATLYTYGILRVELSDPSGNELQLSDGKTSTIEVPVPASMAGSAPATIPLWYLDEETGIWMEEGTATLTGGKYIGTVTHFTDWNCDVPEGTATVTGRVLDCNGVPVPNLSLSIGQGKTVTGSDGKFSRRVPANTSFEITPSGGIISFAPVSVAALPEGQSKAVGDITGSCITLIEISFSDCQVRNIDYVVVTGSWATGNTMLYTDQATLKMAVPPNTSVTVSVASLDNRRGNAEVTSGAVGTTTPVTVTICDGVQVAPSSFTITGAFFNGRVVSVVPVQVFTFSTALSIFNIPNNETEITVAGGGGYSAVIINNLPGKTTGTFSLGGSNPTDLSLTFKDKVGADSVYVSLGSAQSGSVQITEYGAVGELIKGNFTAVIDGTYTDFAFTSSTSITGLTVTGTFQALRNPDEN